MSSIRNGLFWSAVNRYVTRAIGLLTTFVLAALVSPRDFGLMAGALIVMSLFEQFYDFGISKEIVSRQERLEEASHTAFTLNVVLGCLAFVIVILLAPFAGAILGMEGLGGIFVLTGTTLVISSAGKVPAALLQKRQQFKVLVLPLTSAAVMASLVSIGFAFLGAGAYSLAIREVIASIVETGLLIYLSGYRPRWAYDRTLAREILGYAKHLLGAFLVSAVVKQIPGSVIARLFGAAPLGGYSFGSRVAFLPTKEAGNIANRVLFPSFAERRGDVPALHALVYKSTKAMALLAVPTSLFTAQLCGPLIHSLYGSKWDYAIPFFQILPFLALVTTLCGPAGEAVKAVGRTDVQLMYSVVQLVAMLVVIYPAQRLWGATGVALAETFAALAAFLWFTYRATVVLGMPYLRFCASWFGIFIAGALAVVSVFLVRALAPTHHVALSLFLQCTAATATFMALILTRERQFVLSLLPASWAKRFNRSKLVAA